MSYLVLFREYLDCPSCIGADGYPKSRLLSNFREVLNFALGAMDRYEIEMIIRLPSGKILVKDYENCPIEYTTGHHKVISLKIQYKGLNLHTKDNGHGKRIWSKIE